MKTIENTKSLRDLTDIDINTIFQIAGIPRVVDPLELGEKSPSYYAVDKEASEKGLVLKNKSGGVITINSSGITRKIGNANCVVENQFKAFRYLKQQRYSVFS